MPISGSQVMICDLPIRFDTFRGCTHGCKYCFVQQKMDISEVKPFESAVSLKNFIDGKRNKETEWCDWNIPLHWGGVSDPFQPAEKVHKLSLECLKVFKETQYPYVVSTKGALIADPEYSELLAQTNGVLQISLVSAKYDVIEPGAPTFKERVEIIEQLVPKVKRIIVRIQPYLTELKDCVLRNLKLYSAIGVYGVVIEGIKHKKKKPGLVKIAGDFCYPYDALRNDFLEIREEAHRLGLKFYSGENRLRSMGDSLCCCGIDQLEGFTGNKANLNHYLFDPENFSYTEKMKETGTGYYAKAMNQSSVGEIALKNSSYEEVMNSFKKSKFYLRTMVGENG